MYARLTTWLWGLVPGAILVTLLAWIGGATALAAIMAVGFAFAIYLLFLLFLGIRRGWRGDDAAG
jgi:hypothetical protein